VRVGRRCPVGPVHIEIDSMELMPFSAIAEADVRRCGERDRESLRERAAHAGPIADDTLLYRVEFHLVGDEPRRADVMTERGAAAVAPEPGRDSRPLLGPG
jgi:hypothetical protein